MAELKNPEGSVPNWEQRVKQLNDAAKRDLPDGAVTPAYKGDLDQIVGMLNRALAGEWTAFLQYWHHYTQASDIHNPGIRDMWREFANEEYEHAQKINERINQLGGVPANAPAKIAQLSPASFAEGHDMRDMLQADLIGERITVQFYNDIVRACGFDDNETRVLFEQILQDEAEHSNDLSNALYQMDASTSELLPTVHEEVIEEEEQQKGKRAA